MSGPSEASTPFTTSAVPRRPDDLERPRLLAHDPLGRHHVPEVTDVVAVEVGQKDRVAHEREDADRHHAHAHPPAGVDDEQPPAGSHEGGRAGPTGIGQGVPRAQQDDLHAHRSLPPLIRRRAHLAVVFADRPCFPFCRGPEGSGSEDGREREEPWECSTARWPS